MFLQKALEDDIPRWQKKKGMDIYLSDYDHVCFTNMRFADDVLLFASSNKQLQKMLCEFKKSTEKVRLRIHPGKTKILSNRSSDIRKEIEIDDIKVEISARGESTKYLGQMIGDRNQKSSQGCLGNVQQVQTGADIPKQRAQTSTPAIRRSDNSDDMDTHKRARKNIQSTQRKMLRLIKQTKRRYKKIVKRKDETNETKDTGDESENLFRKRY